MQFIDLKSRHQLIGDKINDRIQKVMEHGQFILGPEVRNVEAKLAEYTQSKHCITVSSGTDSLLIALMALDIGLGDFVGLGDFEEASFFGGVDDELAVGDFEGVVSQMNLKPRRILHNEESIAVVDPIYTGEKLLVTTTVKDVFQKPNITQ